MYDITATIKSGSTNLKSSTIIVNSVTRSPTINIGIFENGIEIDTVQKNRSYTVKAKSVTGLVPGDKIKPIIAAGDIQIQLDSIVFSNVNGLQWLFSIPENVSLSFVRVAFILENYNAKSISDKYFNIV